jgi:hypothetical protein
MFKQSAEVPTAISVDPIVERRRRNVRLGRKVRGHDRACEQRGQTGKKRVFGKFPTRRSEHPLNSDVAINSAEASSHHQNL